MPRQPINRNTRTVEEARVAVSKLNLLGVQTFGIFANPAGRDYIPEDSFEANGITEAVMQIRTKVGKDADDESSVAGHGEYVNADSILDIIEKNDPVSAITLILANVRPGVSAGDVIMALPGVRDRFNKAVRLAWET